MFGTGRRSRDVEESDFSSVDEIPTEDLLQFSNARKRYAVVSLKQLIGGKEITAEEAFIYGFCVEFQLSTGSSNDELHNVGVFLSFKRMESTIETLKKTQKNLKNRNKETDLIDLTLKRFEWLKSNMEDRVKIDEVLQTRRREDIVLNIKWPSSSYERLKKIPVFLENESQGNKAYEAFGEEALHAGTIAFLYGHLISYGVGTVWQPVGTEPEPSLPNELSWSEIQAMITKNYRMGLHPDKHSKEEEKIAAENEFKRFNSLYKDNGIGTHFRSLFPSDEKASLVLNLHPNFVERCYQKGKAKGIVRFLDDDYAAHMKQGFEEHDLLRYKEIRNHDEFIQGEINEKTLNWEEKDYLIKLNRGINKFYRICTNFIEDKDRQEKIFQTAYQKEYENLKISTKTNDRTIFTTTEGQKFQRKWGDAVILIKGKEAKEEEDEIQEQEKKEEYEEKEHLNSTPSSPTLTPPSSSSPISDLSPHSDHSSDDENENGVLIRRSSLPRKPSTELKTDHPFSSETQVVTDLPSSDEKKIQPSLLPTTNFSQPSPVIQKHANNSKSPKIPTWKLVLFALFLTALIIGIIYTGGFLGVGVGLAAFSATGTGFGISGGAAATLGTALGVSAVKACAISGIAILSAFAGIFSGILCYFHQSVLKGLRYCFCSCTEGEPKIQQRKSKNRVLSRPKQDRITSIHSTPILQQQGPLVSNPDIAGGTTANLQRSHGLSVTIPTTTSSHDGPNILSQNNNQEQSAKVNDSTLSKNINDVQHKEISVRIPTF